MDYTNREQDVLAGIRQERNRLLSICDWTQMPDVPLTDVQKSAWATYRQALRDLTNGLTDPSQVVWPKVPK